MPFFPSSSLIVQGRYKGNLDPICFILYLDQHRGLGQKGSLACPQGKISLNRKIVTLMGKEFD